MSRYQRHGLRLPCCSELLSVLVVFAQPWDTLVSMMPTTPQEVVLSEGSMKFHRFLSEVLAEAGISTRLVPAAAMPEAERQRWSVGSEFEACLVTASVDERNAKALIEYTVQNCKICLHCEEVFVRPGEKVCPECGRDLDPRHPDEIRAQYERDCRDAEKRPLNSG